MFCLTVATDPAWVLEAMRDVDAVLVDHAHCEMKAASNALSLAARQPRSMRLVLALTDLAREELDHFQQVVRLLERRGIPLGAPPVDRYAAELRRAAATLPERHLWASLVDRLLVGALIEARSCERFKLLLGALEGAVDAPGMELRAVYKELFASEARHYRVFVDLAIDAARQDAGAGEGAVTSRLARLAALEGAIVVSLAELAERGAESATGDAPKTRATMHG